MKILQKVSQSLFLRLLAIFGGTSLLFTLVFACSIYWMHDHSEMGLQHLERYGRMLANDIGIPPDLERAEELTALFPIQILIDGPDLHWRSPGVFLVSDEFQVIEPLSDNVRVVRFSNATALQFSFNNYRYTLFDPRAFSPKNYSIVALGILLGLCALLLNYYLVRRLLLVPVRQLQRGAERISKGDLNYRMEERAQHELGDLTTSVNRMADSLQAMLNAKQQLLLAISHELRTPITRAKLQLEFIADPQLKAELGEDLNELDLLVTELLEAERLNSHHAPLNCTAIELNSFAQQVLAQHWPDHPRIQLHKAELSQPIAGDVLRLTLLLRNLISNALRHSGNDPVSVAIHYQAGCAQLSVSDQGTGIAPEHIPHLTEAFYRVDAARHRNTGGFGLGLHLCDLIAKAHGGKLIISSTVGQGTCVTVELPLAPQVPKP